MLKGKVAVITGSSTGIGAATAIKFAKEGAKGVIIHGRQEEALKKVKQQCEQAAGKGDTNDKIHICVGDITDENVRNNLINAAIDNFGQLDVLVNNAGVGALGGLVQCPIESYDNVFNVNLRSVIALTKIATPHLIKSKGNVINISSAASVSPSPLSTYYCCTKAALDMFTKCAAQELSPQGVRVNSINPGYVPETEIMTRQGVDMSGQEMKPLVDKMIEAVPVRRPGKCEEIADSIAYVASDQATFVTGSIIMVDGGYAIMSRFH